MTGSHSVQVLLVAALVDKRAEHALFLLEQLTRLAELDDVSSVENHLVIGYQQLDERSVNKFTNNFVGVHDRLQTVRNSNHRHILLEFRTQRLLDHSVGFIV